MKMTLRYGNWSNAKLALTVEQWLKRRETLAAALGNDGWGAVETYYLALDRMLRATELVAVGQEVADTDRQTLAQLDGRGKEAASAMGRLAA
jgi:hypothetical protein